MRKIFSKIPAYIDFQVVLFLFSLKNPILEIRLFQFIKWIIFKGYGYETMAERQNFGVGKCAGCDASWVQDWIDNHIELIKLFK